ncbi:type II toxin-antitoxin system RelE/ParE family toxin [Polaribacter sp. Z014]|uniref:type II toxin-antitoxin system RelE family toxin n=1 Tax=Polaribacter sp. Z014 TaxID=2927126 RepID=UPI002020E687|nr:type II toxin-antitoxin system RelE/ParE family toxin [Polaribacter sp. Z014]MCL7762309.1 type II toxin-antitoxin system RelE/ParE family toxin [Polaribacter sp. Z014]
MKVIYLKSLEKDLKKIKDKKLLKQLETVFINLEEKEILNQVSNVMKMSGHKDFYRIRIGNYRLGIHYSEETITIVRFVKREDIYKLFP